MEDDKFGLFFDVEFDCDSSYKLKQTMNLLNTKERIRFFTYMQNFLPLKSKVVRFGCMVILYLVGCAKAGNLMLSQGNTCKIFIVFMTILSELLWMVNIWTYCTDFAY